MHASYFYRISSIKDEVRFFESACFSTATPIKVVIEIVTKIEIESGSESVRVRHRSVVYNYPSSIESSSALPTLIVLSSNLFFIYFQVSRL